MAIPLELNISASTDGLIRSFASVSSNLQSVTGSLTAQFGGVSATIEATVGKVNGMASATVNLKGAFDGPLQGLKQYAGALQELPNIFSSGKLSGNSKQITQLLSDTFDVPLKPLQNYLKAIDGLPDKLQKGQWGAAITSISQPLEKMFQGPIGEAAKYATGIGKVTTAIQSGDFNKIGNTVSTQLTSMFGVPHETAQKYGDLIKGLGKNFDIKSIDAYKMGLEGLNNIIHLGMEAWGLWNDKKKEALSIKNAQETDEELNARLKKEIEMLKQSGVVTEQQANEMELRIAKARADGTGNAEHTALKNTAQEVLNIEAEIRQKKKEAEEKAAEEAVKRNAEVAQQKADKNLQIYEEQLKREKEAREKAAKPATTNPQSSATTPSTSPSVPASTDALGVTQMGPDNVRIATEAFQAVEKAATEYDDVLSDVLTNLEKIISDYPQLSKLPDLLAKAKSASGQAVGSVDKGSGASGSVTNAATSTAGNPGTAQNAIPVPGQSDKGATGSAKGSNNQIAQWGKQWQDLGKNVSNVLDTGVKGAVDGVSKSIGDAINGTAKWGDTFAQVGKSIITNLVQVVVQWVMQMTVVRALKAVMGAEDEEQATETASSWSMAAIMASIGSWGAAAAIGLAAVISAMAFGGFAEGGLIPGGEQLIRVNERGPEFVIPAHRVAQFGTPFFEGIRTGAVTARNLQPNVATPVTSASGGGGAGSGFGSSPVSVQPAPVKVVVVNSQEDLKRAMESSMGEDITIAHVRKNKMKLGIPS